MLDEFYREINKAAIKENFIMTNIKEELIKMADIKKMKVTHLRDKAKKGGFKKYKAEQS